MSALPFLLDEDVPEFLADEIIRTEPGVIVPQVGLAGVPPKGTKDPQPLVFAEEHGMTLVTMDKRSMPGHLKAHFELGRHTCGVLLLRQGFPITSYAEELVLIWSPYDENELVDNTMYLPLQ